MACTAVLHGVFAARGARPVDSCNLCRAMTTSLVRMAVAFTCVVMAACGSNANTPAGPSVLQGPMTGTWTGTLVRQGVTTRVSMTITEYDFVPGRVITMTGTFAAAENEAPASSGTLVGTNQDGAVSLTLQPGTRASCTLPFGLRPGDVSIEGRLEGTTLKGTTTHSLCDGSPVSTVTLTRQ